MNFDVSGKLTNSGGGALVPVGCILPYCGTSIPNNWLYCAGLTVSRSEYPELFATIGTRFGAGDGSTTFKIPDLREKFIFGANPGTPDIENYTLGTTGGSKNAVLIRHNHTFSGTNKQGRVGCFRTENNQNLACESPFSADNSLLPSDGNWWDSPDNDWGLKGFKFDYTPAGSISYEGEDGTNKNMPPYACFYYIIRAK